MIRASLCAVNLHPFPRLVASKVEFVLVGGFAAVAHGVTLVTRDVDICCWFSEANLMRLQRAFADLHSVHHSRPDLSSGCKSPLLTVISAFAPG